MNNLPIEIVYNILYKLDYKSITNLLLTNKSIYDTIINDNFFWYKKILCSFKNVPQFTQFNKNINYYNKFISFYKKRCIECFNFTTNNYLFSNANGMKVCYYCQKNNIKFRTINYTRIKKLYLLSNYDIKGLEYHYIHSMYKGVNMKIYLYSDVIKIIKKKYKTIDNFKNEYTRLYLQKENKLKQYYSIELQLINYLLNNNLPYDSFSISLLQNLYRIKKINNFKEYLETYFIIYLVFDSNSQFSYIYNDIIYHIKTLKFKQKISYITELLYYKLLWVDRQFINSEPFIYFTRIINTKFLKNFEKKYHEQIKKRQYMINLLQSKYYGIFLDKLKYIITINSSTTNSYILNNIISDTNFKDINYILCIEYDIINKIKNELLMFISYDIYSLNKNLLEMLYNYIENKYPTLSQFLIDIIKKHINKKLI